MRSRPGRYRLRPSAVFVLLVLLSLRSVCCGQTALDDLPLTEYPSRESRSPCCAVLISGDGGLGELVRVIAVYLQDRGVPVVVLDALRYFRSEKKPAVIARDLLRIKDYYLHRWKGRAVIYLGYSMGADVLPFALNLMPDAELANTRDVIMVAPAQKAVFVIGLMDYLYGRTGDADIYLELRKLRLHRVYCIDDDGKDSLGRLDLRNVVDHVTLKGGHHFGHDYPTLCAVIGRRLGLQQATR